MFLDLSYFCNPFVLRTKPNQNYYGFERGISGTVFDKKKEYVFLVEKVWGVRWLQ